MENKKKVIRSTEDVLSILCRSVSEVLSKTTNSKIRFSPTIQKISKTCLKPDIGCFVVFEGAFSGIIIINMSADAAVEMYQKYMQMMGMPADELAQVHTSDDVGNALGELMNQIVGDFQGELEHLADISINQTQPKMLVINKELVLSINANIDRPQSRRVVFSTENRNTFYLEMSMEKTEFVSLDGFVDEKYLSKKDTGLSKDENHQQFMDDLGI
jgi:chemotaxis protein CheY-P-specific phosphatase CheC